jgi:hypothetical protein
MGMTGRQQAVALIGAALVTITLAGGAAAVDGFRAKMEKWVETRQLISKETNEWDSDREFLRSTRDLLKQQKAALEASIADLERSGSETDEERRALLLRRAEIQENRPVIEARIRAMELQSQALAARFPSPLRKKLEPLLVQIPEVPELAGLSLGQRLMNVLGILAQAEKWNGTVTLAGETRPMGDGEKVQVRTLYWGLGQAIYVDAVGERAGIGRPGAEGWEFTSQPELAGDAGRLIDIYEGNIDAIEFVMLPIEIQ